MKATILTLTTLLALTSCNSTPDAPANLHDLPVAAQYDALCARCHDPERIGAKPSKLIDAPRLPPETMRGQTNETLRAIIAKGGKAVGKKATMPAFETILTNDEITVLIHYLKTRP